MDEDLFILNTINEDPKMAELFGILTLCLFAFCAIVLLISGAITLWQKWSAK